MHLKTFSSSCHFLTPLVSATRNSICCPGFALQVVGEAPSLSQSDINYAYLKR